jgi:DNA-binding NtrC family response regulator
MLGYRVLTATNVQEALTLFESEEVDVMLADHLLLKGETGTSLAEEMKRRKPHVPVAIYSGVPEIPEDIDKADVFITKLVSPDELFAYLEKTIAAKCWGSEHQRKYRQARSAA